MREPTEMELRVAKAHHQGRLRRGYTECPWRQLSTEDVAEYFSAAADGIKAMRGPTEEMDIAGGAYVLGSAVDGEIVKLGAAEAETVWQAMIDAASPPDEG